MTDLHIEPTPLGWTAYYDPEGLTGEGNTEMEAVSDLLEKTDERLSDVLSERGDLRRELAEANDRMGRDYFAHSEAERLLDEYQIKSGKQQARIGELEQGIAKAETKSVNVFDNCMAEATRARELYLAEREYAGQLRAALERIAARGPYSVNGGMACATCRAFWHPDPVVIKFQSEHHYERCAYVIARDALAVAPRVVGRFPEATEALLTNKAPEEKTARHPYEPNWADRVCIKCGQFKDHAAHNSPPEEGR